MCGINKCKVLIELEFQSKVKRKVLWFVPGPKYKLTFLEIFKRDDSNIFTAKEVENHIDRPNMDEKLGLYVFVFD